LCLAPLLPKQASLVPLWSFTCTYISTTPFTIVTPRLQEILRIHVVHMRLFSNRIDVEVSFVVTQTAAVCVEIGGR
jgi:hypothetical protein